MSNADQIERAIADVLAAQAELAGIKRFFLGMPYAVPTGLYPYAMIVIDSEEGDPIMTGGRAERFYSGAIVFHVVHQDLPQEVAARIAQIPSYATLRGFMDTAIRALRSQTGQQLGGLALSNGYLRGVEIGVEAVSYGVTAEAERPDNLLNYGVIPFTVQTVETF